MGRRSNLLKPDGIFRQYVSIKLEIDTLGDRIRRVEDKIARIVEEGTVKDRVYGGEGGIQGFNIEGFPVEEYEEQLGKLRELKRMLVSKEGELVRKEIEVEQYVSKIPVSRERIILRAIVLEGRKQEEIARQLHIERSLVSKIIAKYV